jgi:hypothetical protein
MTPFGRVSPWEESRRGGNRGLMYEKKEGEEKWMKGDNRVVCTGWDRVKAIFDVACHLSFCFLYIPTVFIPVEAVWPLKQGAAVSCQSI